MLIHLVLLAPKQVESVTMAPASRMECLDHLQDPREVQGGEVLLC